MLASDSTLHRASKHQVANPHHVVGSHRKCETPSNAIDPTEARLAICTDSLHPAEDLLHALANALTDEVTRLTNRASVDRGGHLALGNVWGGMKLTKVLHAGSSIVALVHADGDSVAAGDCADHLNGSLRFSRPGADAHAMVYDQCL